MANLRIPLDYEEKQLPRAVWNLSTSGVTSLMQCLDVPLHFEQLYPKDDFDVDYEHLLQSMPMAGQLVNGWKMRIFSFVSDLSNYYSWMDNNSRTKVDEIKNRQHHYISPFRGSADQNTIIYRNLYGPNPAVEYNTYLNPIIGVVPGTSSAGTDYNLARVEAFCVHSDSMLEYIGIPRGFFSNTVYKPSAYSSAYCFNADFILCYLDSVRNYLVNNQYGSVPYIVKLPNITDINASSISHSGMIPQIINLELSEIDKFFRLLRLEKNGVDLMKFALDNLLTGIATWLSSLKYGGAFFAQYEKDMLTGILYSNNYDDVLISVDENGNFSINQLRFRNRQQRKADREAISGGRYSNELRTVWGAKNDKRMDIPELVGVSSYDVSARGVVTTADTYDPNTGNGNSVGQLNGLVNSRQDNSYKNSIKVSNHSVLMYMIQLVPDVMYSNGLGKGLDAHYFDSEYSPQFDQLGFQDVPLYKYNALPSYNVETGSLQLHSNDTQFNRVVGKTIPFIDMISNVNRVRGKFASDEYFSTWVLNRTFDESYYVPYVNGSTPDVTKKIVGIPDIAVVPYANPLHYQYPFVAESADDPNFIFVFKLYIRAIRCKGKSYMPTLGE